MKFTEIILVACVLWCTGAGVAAAQQPAPSPSPSAAPAPPKLSVANYKTHKPPMPVLELMPTLSSSIGGDEFSPVEPASNPFVRSDVRLSYRFTYNFLPRLSFSYFHNAAIADNTLGRAVTETGKVVYPQSARDILDDVGFSYALSSGPVDHGYVRGAYNYEHRVCCGAANDPNNLFPAAWHSYYVEAQYKTTPITPMKWVFSFTERATLALHKTTAAYIAALPPGYTDSNRNEYGYTQTLGAQFNIDPKTVAFGNFMWGATYFFDNAPFPYQSDTFDYGVMRPITRWFSLRAEINQQTQRPQGYPFLFPNTLHRTKLVVTGDFRIAP